MTDVEPGESEVARQAVGKQLSTLMTLPLGWTMRLSGRPPIALLKDMTGLSHATLEKGFGRLRPSTEARAIKHMRNWGHQQLKKNDWPEEEIDKLLNNVPKDSDGTLLTLASLTYFIETPHSGLLSISTEVASELDFFVAELQTCVQRDTPLAFVECRGCTVSKS